MELKLETCLVRSFHASDAESIARYADNKKIWRNLRDAFPHPYTLDDAYGFISMVHSQSPETIFCIARDNAAIGAIGFTIQEDVNRISAEIGYWIGEPFWGKGVMTEVLRAVTDYAIDAHGLSRIFATPFSWNQASCRVLEKAGYKLEGRLKSCALKDGQIIDQFLLFWTSPKMWKIKVVII